MACELDIEGTIATIRVEVAARDSDGDEVPFYRVFRVEGGLVFGSDELVEELTGIAQRTFNDRDIAVRSVSFSPGSLIASILLVGSIVIETGAFLSGLREIRHAVEGPIDRFIERAAMRNGTAVSAGAVDAVVVLGAGALNAGVKQSDQPAPSTNAAPPRVAGPLSEPAIIILSSAALVALIIIALLIAADAG